jgi:hypothetical protein
MPSNSAYSLLVQEVDFLYKKASDLYSLSDSLSSENPLVADKIATSADETAIQFVSKLALAMKKKSYEKDAESPYSEEKKHSDMIKYTKKEASVLRYLSSGLGHIRGFTKNHPVVSGLAAGAVGTYGGGKVLTDYAIDKGKRAIRETIDETASKGIGKYIPMIGTALAAAGATYLGTRALTGQKPVPQGVTSAANRALQAVRPKTAELLASCNMYERLVGSEFEKQAALLVSDIIFGRD